VQDLTQDAAHHLQGWASNLSETIRAPWRAVPLPSASARRAGANGASLGQALPAAGTVATDYKVQVCESPLASATPCAIAAAAFRSDFDESFLTPMAAHVAQRLSGDKPRHVARRLSAPLSAEPLVAASAKRSRVGVEDLEALEPSNTVAKCARTGMSPGMGK
jgi:hypothetical protein